MRRALLISLILVSAGCATEQGWRMPYGDENSRAPGAAFSGDAMMIRKDMPHQQDPKPWDFYYKHCAINGEEDVYSKNSYDCTGPSF